MSINCFFLIDKPLHITSFDVLRELKKKLNIKKIGHTGTLDPLASGCLFIAVGDYTKLIPYFEKDTKEYEFKIMLDGESDSYDMGTQIRYINKEQKDYFKKTITLDYIKKILKNNFTGEIDQLPPKYSALKIGGKKALDLVKSGKDFELKSRKVFVQDIEIIGFEYPSLHLKATVSAGTYIRSIANDLGGILGTGGYISYLRRTKIGNLNIKDAKKLDNISIDDNLSVLKIFDNNYIIKLDSYILNKINNGIKQTADLTLKEDKIYFVVDDFNNITNVIKYIDKRVVGIRKISNF